MKKIQLFAAPTINALQSQINEWLTDNKDARLIETNITTLVKASVLAPDKPAEGQYAFYILYSSADQNEDGSVLAASMHMPSELTDPKTIETEVN